MLSRPDASADVSTRPFNNLLRRLDRADFALLEPHLIPAQARAGDLFYSPGDDVDTVHAERDIGDCAAPDSVQDDREGNSDHHHANADDLATAP